MAEAQDKMNGYMDLAKSKGKELWDGNVPLAETFWRYYFLPVLCLKLAGFLLSFLSGLTSLVAILWAGFMVKPIWLSSDKYKDNNLYAILAKVAAVVIALAVFGHLFS